MDEFIGVIKLFAGKFAPDGWAFCDGSLLTINSNPSLFSIIETIYGGDGITTFALPDLRSRVPIGAGTPSTLTKITLGQTGGSEAASLPAHTHTATLTNATTTVQGTFSVNNQVATLEQPAVGCSIAGPITDDGGYPPVPKPTLGFNNQAPNTAIAGLNLSGGLVTGTVTVAPAGSGVGDNRQPFLGLNYIICTSGLYPTQGDN
ncbi:MAG: phage tail protein [Chitinophagaceae bacterium]